MANKILYFTSADGGSVVPILAVDNGDGTYNIGTSGGGGTVTVAVTGTLPVSIQGIPSTYDAGPAWTSVFGVAGAAVVSGNITGATAVTDAPTSGQKLIITDVLVSAAVGMSILLEEETSGTDIALLYVPANGIAQWTPRGKTKLATANKKLTARSSVTGSVGITVHYYSEA